MPNFGRIISNLVNGLDRLNWSSDKLVKYQEEKLSLIIRNAYENVPYYHNLMRESGIYPDDIKTLTDLQKIPATKKDVYRKMPVEELLSKKVVVSKLKPQSTSGSSGSPLKFYLNPEEDDWRKAIYLRCNISCGQTPFDNWAMITAPRHFHDTTNFQRITNLFSQRCISVFDKVEDQIAQLIKMKVSILDGYSGATFILAKEVEKRGITDIRPKMVLGSADIIDKQSCRYIEKVFDAPYYDQFGCAEVDRTAWQCPERNFYHMDSDSVITEFIGKDGEVVGPGESGEVTYTSLYNTSMPFIRYSIGDIGRPAEGRCHCGRSLPLMEVVEGRKDSFIVLPDGRMISPRVLTVGLSTFEYYDKIDQFRIVQKKVNLFDVYLKMKSNGSSNQIILDSFYSHFKKVLGVQDAEIEFNVNFVDELPLDKTGRLNAVTSELS